jgi:integrase
MKRSRTQKGHVYLKGGSWYVRYYDFRISADGTIERVQKAHRLGRAINKYRSKKAANQLAEEFLAPINAGRFSPESMMTVTQFAENVYLPFVETHKRVSTFHGYRNMWKRYLRDRCEIALRDFRTADGEQILDAIAETFELTGTTLRHIKALLSGVFRYAKRQGVINSENPMRDVVIPKAKAASETYAYSLEEILHMLPALPEPAATIVAAAAFTGARKGEIRGFRWEDYDGERIRISQSYWRGHVLQPKTPKSKAPVPIISQLRERLDFHRLLVGNPAAGLMFQSPEQKALNLDALAVDVIRPAIEKRGLAWHGWHAFRRGLATNLHRLGVRDETVQRILRHSTVAVTQNCYIKTADDEVIAAMSLLESAPNMHPERNKRSQ